MNLSELEELKKAANLIEEMSFDRQHFKSGGNGFPFICSTDAAYIGIEMRADANQQTQRYDITFGAYARRTGDLMDSNGLRTLSQEVGQAYALLLALEMQKFNPTEYEMREFAEIIRQRDEQESSQENSPDMRLSL
jgi:hypothetical protein